MKQFKIKKYRFSRSNRFVFLCLFIFGTSLIFQNCSLNKFSSSMPMQVQKIDESSLSISRVYKKEHSQLALNQPPVSLSSEGKIGLNVNCFYWDMNEKSLNDCIGDLDLIKNLNVGSVRIGIHWYMMTESDGYTLTPWKVEFLKKYLNAARTRGLKILYSILDPAPVGAFKCNQVINPPTAPSGRLDFCDEIFSKYFSNMMDLVLPFTPHIELLNETNWDYDKNAPFYSALNIEDYRLSRSKQLYFLAQQVLDEKRALRYSALLLSQGISFFYDASFPQKGWASYDKPLIKAIDYIYWMKNGSQPSGRNTYDDAINIVAVHPYFKSAEYTDLVQHFVDEAKKLSANSRKDIWMTETSSDQPDDDDKVRVFNQLKYFLDSDLIQKAFWFAVRVGQPSEAHSDDQYGIYNRQRVLKWPQVAAAIKQYMSTMPVEKIFLPEEYRQPIEDGTISTPISIAESGVCGGAQGGSLTSAPISNLCAVGSASAVSTSSSSYQWSCAGRNGGSSASCVATRLVDVVITPPVVSNSEPTCEMSAENGQLDQNGKILKYGRISWKVSNAQSAEYVCIENNSYTEFGIIDGGQYKLQDSVQAKADLKCGISTLIKLDGTRVHISTCAAASYMKK